jgi:GntR family transcriptional regulator
MISGDERLPLYQRLRDELSTRIAEQHWRAGEAIPSEAELAKHYDVSIGTVRKAIDSLVKEGMIERLHGKGTYVRRARFNASLFRFFRMQNLAGERRIPEGRVLRMELTEAPSIVISNLKLAPGTQAINISRLRLFDGNPMLAESIWLPHDRFAPLLALKPSEFPDLLYPMYEQRFGQVIASAKESLTAEAVGPLHARLLQIEAGSPVMVIERLALGFDQHPIEWRLSRGPASEFRYHVEIR